MAKPKIDRVAVVAGARIFYAGDYFNPGDVVYMPAEEADDFIAMRQATFAQPGDLKRARGAAP